jgi:hypothetical protein
MKYIIFAESANYCGYGQHFVVLNALSEEDAHTQAEAEIEEYFYEQDSDQLEEEGQEADTYGSVVSIEEFDETHSTWKYYIDPSQSEFYIEV